MRRTSTQMRMGLLITILISCIGQFVLGGNPLIANQAACQGGNCGGRGLPYTRGCNGGHYCPAGDTGSG
jgi:hypothetical protein